MFRFLRAVLWPWFQSVLFHYAFSIFFFVLTLPLFLFTLEMQGNCTFREDLSIFNCTYPSAGNPYVLDLTEPYKAAVLEELMVRTCIRLLLFCFT